MIAAFLLQTVLTFQSPGRLEVHAADVNLHAGPTTSLVFVARDDTIDRQGFVIWTDITPHVQRYMVFPRSAYRGRGSYWVTHQDIVHPGPNTGAEITATGGHAVLWHGDYLVNGQALSVDQANYRYYPPIYLDLP